MDYNALTAWTGLGTAFFAVYAVWTESRRHRFSMSLDLMLRLEERFSTKRMYVSRQKAARAFESGKLEEAVNEIDEIVNFFEGVGYLVERGAIDKKAVWISFFWYMDRFFHFTAEYIGQERQRDPTLWSAFLHLYSGLHEIEVRERKKQVRKRTLPAHTRDLGPTELSQFLREETTLDLSAD